MACLGFLGFMLCALAMTSVAIAENTDTEEVHKCSKDELLNIKISVSGSERNVEKQASTNVNSASKDDISELLHNQQQLEEHISIQNRTLYKLAAELDKLKPAPKSNQIRDTCPNGTIRWRQSCYKFHDVSFTLPESVVFCDLHGSSLVVLETTEEHEFLVGLIKASSVKRDYWVAATDATLEGEWKWVTDGTPATLPWHGNQPDNHQGKEDCAMISKGRKFLVNDISCDTKYFPLCEMHLDI